MSGGTSSRRGGARAARQAARLATHLTNEPGTHFLGHPDTLQSFETAFSRSTAPDNRSFEQWQAEGWIDASRRAKGQWNRMLAEYEPPPLDDAVDEELREWVERAKASFPDSNA